MAGDDDIAAQIPDPPPPAPLRRQAAIGAAMRRFDAQGGQPMPAPAPAPEAHEPWWTRIGRPQAAALVTAGLVVLFGVPAAWLSVSQRDAPMSRRQLASVHEAASTQSASAPLAEPPSDAMVAPALPDAASAPVARPEQSTAFADAAVAGAETKDKEARAAPQTVAASAAPMELARAERAPAEAPAPMVVAKQGSDSRRDQPVRLADAASPPRAAGMFAPPPPAAPPPPPPPVMVASAEPTAAAGANFATEQRAAKMRESDDGMVAGRSRLAAAQTGDMVVTGQRRSAQKSAGRGDWNACTIDDPSRSLMKCKGQIDPAAAGPKGRSAAYVADGLMRAWQGDFDGAITAFDQAIAINPRNATAYLNRGLALQRKGEFSRAGADLDRAVRYAPGAARSYYTRGRLLRQRGEAARAEADEDRAIALDPAYVAVVK